MGCCRTHTFLSDQTQAITQTPQPLVLCSEGQTLHVFNCCEIDGDVAVEVTTTTAGVVTLYFMIDGNQVPESLRRQNVGAGITTLSTSFHKDVPTKMCCPKSIQLCIFGNAALAANVTRVSGHVERRPRF